MREYKKEKRTEEVEVAEFIKCDFCVEEAPRPRMTSNYSHSVNWLEGGYESCETEISISEGENYPECGSSVILRFDICPKCFKEKLIPWAKSQGAEVTEYESDW